jgi:hypothetical protein
LVPNAVLWCIPTHAHTRTPLAGEGRVVLLAATDVSRRVSGEDHFSCCKPPRASARYKALVDWSVKRHPRWGSVVMGMVVVACREGLGRTARGACGIGVPFACTCGRLPNASGRSEVAPATGPHPAVLLWSVVDGLPGARSPRVEPGCCGRPMQLKGIVLGVSFVCCCVCVVPWPQFGSWGRLRGAGVCLRRVQRNRGLPAHCWHRLLAGVGPPCLLSFCIARCSLQKFSLRAAVLGTDKVEPASRLKVDVPARCGNQTEAWHAGAFGDSAYHGSKKKQVDLVPGHYTDEHSDCSGIILLL